MWQVVLVYNLDQADVKDAIMDLVEPWDQVVVKGAQRRENGSHQQQLNVKQLPGTADPFGLNKHNLRGQKDLGPKSMYGKNHLQFGDLIQLGNQLLHGKTQLQIGNPLQFGNQLQHG